MTIPGAYYPAPADKSSYFNALTSVLTAIQNTYTAAAVPLPARQYVHMGSVVADCEQLTVQFVQAYLGVPGGNPNELHRGNGPQTIHVTAEIWRCEPVVNSGIPSAEVLTAASEVLLIDAYLLMASLGAIDAGTGWDTGLIADLAPRQPGGGLIGVAMNITMPV